MNADIHGPAQPKQSPPNSIDLSLIEAPPVAVNLLEGARTQSRIFPLAKLASRLFGDVGAKTAMVLILTSEEHEKMDKTDFVLRLRRYDCDLETVRCAQVINYRLALAQENRLIESLSTYGEHPEHKKLLDNAERSIVLLERDLQCPISRRTETTTETLPGLKPKFIQSIEPLEGVPDITSLASLGGLLVLAVGSGFGSAIQARRQIRNFSLSGETNSGAEYLNSFGKLNRQGIKLIKAGFVVDALLPLQGDLNEAVRTVGGTMDALAKEFEKNSKANSFGVEIQRRATESESVSKLSNSKFKRAVFTGLGIASLGLAVAGYILPVVPGTVFLLSAGYFFARGSAKLNNWVRGNKKFGPILENWEKNRSIPVKGKIMAATGMAIGVASTIVFSAPPLVFAATAVFCSLSALYVLTRPNGPKATSDIEKK